MKTLKTYLRPLLINFLISFVVLSGCEEEKPKEEIKFVAKVGDKYLTAEEVSEEIGKENYSLKYREEFIQDWIDEQVLFQQASESGILKKESYKKIIDESKKKLAQVLYLEDFFDNLDISFTSDSIFRYYNRNREDFLTTENIYITNHAVFDDYKKAAQFRRHVEQNGWINASEFFPNENIQLRKLLYESDVDSPLLLRAVKSLEKNELSVVITTKPERFEIVQLVNKIEEGTIPDFNIIRKDVEQRFLFVKRKEMLDKHLQELYKKFNVEYKKDLE